MMIVLLFPFGKLILFSLINTRTYGTAQQFLKGIFQFNFNSIQFNSRLKTQVAEKENTN